jgi:hypothetical protein
MAMGGVPECAGDDGRMSDERGHCGNWQLIGNRRKARHIMNAPCSSNAWSIHYMAITLPSRSGSP